MPRVARLVIPGLPHHVTQRGNQRQQTFFGESDCRLYVQLLGRWCEQTGTAVWAWCLMPNHVHLILVPSREDGLAVALRQTHGRYATLINARQDGAGHLWQGRYGSFVMDERHLIACARYVELNPVRAGLAATPAEWPWSSARAHLGQGSDGLTRTGPLLDRWPDWAAVLEGGLDPALRDAIRGRERTGRPLGDAAFLAELAARGRGPVLPRRVRVRR